jgi:hypothetical protein
MKEAPSKAVMYFGTGQPASKPKLLRAGPLTAELDDGNLRTIRIGGKEAIRGLAFIVRDRNWGTYNPVLSNLKVGQGPNSFDVSYDAVCKDGRQELHYKARIKGSSDGSLVFEGMATAVTDFLTNRTGFVVLHPIEGVAGHWVRVEHADGRVEEALFPDRIDPTCPFQDIRALTHEVGPGVKVKLTMEGDAFEMEDHRNWNDASYKTYVRPLARPWPFTIAAGESSRQRVTLAIEGTPPSAGAGTADQPVQVRLGAETGRVPAFGMSLRPDHLDATLDAIDRVRDLNPAFLVCPFDSRIADGFDATRRTGVSTFPFDERTLPRGKVMAAYRQIGEATGIPLILEAVIACRAADGSPSESLEIMRRDIAAVRRAAGEAGVDFAMIALSPATDLKCTLPESVWPPCPPLTEIYAAGRAAFPGKPVIGGMFSYFTELNRKRPPTDALDAVMHTSCPIVHAADDRTVMENLEALPHIIRSVRGFAGGRPYRVGPVAIGARDNPYGAGCAANPDNGRYALAAMDPRQRGLLGSAWYLGYAAHMARGEVDAVALAAPVGEFGLIYTRTDYPQPWFDDAGAKVYPGYFTLKALGAASGQAMRASAVSDGTRLQALAYRDGGRTVLLVANLTGVPLRAAVEGGGPVGEVTVLDEESFVLATTDPDRFIRQRVRRPLDALELPPYATARIVLRAA